MFKNHKFERTITKLGIAALALNGLIGAGIFVLPSAAAELSGNFSPWMFVICGLLMSTIILSFSQLSTDFSNTGGPVLYAQKAFGNHLAFQTTWLLFIGRLTALAANSNALVFYLALFIPALNEGVAHSFALAFVIVILTVLNLVGVNRAMKTLSILTFLKIIPLLVFISVGLFYIEPSKIFTINIAEISDFDGALLLLIYAFIGFEGAVVPAGESKNPHKNIASALCLILAFTIVFYFLIQSISISVLANINTSSTPLADAAENIFGYYGAIIITIVAVISIGGNLFAVIFTAPRMLYSLAVTDNLPDWFAKLSPANQSPVNAIIFLSFFSLVLAVSGSFIWLAVISTLTRLIGYFISILALIKLQGEFVERNKWFLPLGITIPVMALFICFWLSLQASLTSWLMTLIFILLGSCLYYLRKKVTRIQN